MIVGLQPSYWQRIVAGLVVIVPTLVVGAFAISWFTRSVLEPRAAGRRWPEGARGVRPLVEVVVDAQRRPVVADDRTGSEDRLVREQVARFGLVAASCAVLPVSTGLVLTQPHLGLYTLAIVLLIDALLDGLVVAPARDTNAARLGDPARIGLAALLALAAGVVHAQWGSGMLPSIAAAQAHAVVGGTHIRGVPTFVVQPLGFLVASAACFVSVVAMADGPAVRAGALPGLCARLVNASWMLAIAAWLVATFVGAGAVPWKVDNPGTRQVVSVVVFSAKTVLATLALAWARATWPSVPVRTVRLLLALGSGVAVGSIAMTLLVRHLV
ncbi:MAG: hypothetical protein JST73_00760 [Actinobacteria bacterium]|nr:hypothetical protein [Actinomycetota bacterium]